jgi:hypothetical protein
MIAEAFEKIKTLMVKPVEVENEWNEYPSKPRIQSTVEVEPMDFNQHAEHIWGELKK